jgi:hypothetical protein
MSANNEGFEQYFTRILILKICSTPNLVSYSMARDIPELDAGLGGGWVFLAQLERAPQRDARVVAVVALGTNADGGHRGPLVRVLRDSCECRCARFGSAKFGMQSANKRKISGNEIQ